MHPFAYGLIAYAGEVVRQGRIERPGLGGEAMQAAVASEVIAALAGVGHSPGGPPVR